MQLFIFYLYLIFHTCDVRFDAEKFYKIYKELNKANRPIIYLQLTPGTAAKQAATRSTGTLPQRILSYAASDALHVRRPPRINLVSDALTWRAPTARPLPPPRHVCVLRIVYAESVRAHVRAVHTHAGIFVLLVFFLSFFPIHVTVLYPPTG